MKHYRTVTKLFSEHDWSTAADYHHRVFERVEDGSFDLSDGEDGWSLAQALFKVANKGKGKKKTGAALTWCEYHGYCSHVSSTCTQKAEHGQGKKAKNFQAKR